MIYKDSNGKVNVGPEVVCWPHKAQQRRSFPGRGGEKGKDSSGGNTGTAKGGNASLSPQSMLR
jgi:hypothetical protein